MALVRQSVTPGLSRREGEPKEAPLPWNGVEGQGGLDRSGFSAAFPKSGTVSAGEEKTLLGKPAVPPDR